MTFDVDEDEQPCCVSQVCVCVCLCACAGGHSLRRWQLNGVVCWFNLHLQQTDWVSGSLLCCELCFNTVATGQWLRRRTHVFIPARPTVCVPLQNETEKLQNQLSSARSQQSRDAEKHQLLVGSLNEQLRG